jgi:hypothetical protein
MAMNKRNYNKKNNKKKFNNKKRQAYKPRRKQQFANARRPFVECKSRTHEEIASEINNATEMIDPTDFNIIPNDTGGSTPVAQTVVQLPVWSYCNMTQGLGESEMIGLQCYSKYLKAKLQFKLPDGAEAITHQCDMYLVHGFVKAPYGATSFTTPTAPLTTRADYKAYIKNHIKDFFDQREDKLRFIPRQNTNLQILGYKRIKNNRNTNLGVGHYGTAQGTFPMINMSCYWPMKKKTYYTPGKDQSNNLQFLYPNTTKIPFMCVYNPTAAQFQAGTQYCVKVAYNDSHWFTDS